MTMTTARHEMSLAQRRAADTKLFHAVKDNDTLRIAQALHDGAYVNARKPGMVVITSQHGKTGRFSTPLLEATRLGHLDSMRALLNHGANANSFNVSHKTAMHVAVMKRNVEAVEMLLAVDSNLQLRNADGKTALENATTHYTRYKDVDSFKIATRLRQVMERELAPLKTQGTIGRRPAPEDVGIQMTKRQTTLNDLRTDAKKYFQSHHMQTTEQEEAPAYAPAINKETLDKLFPQGRKTDAPSFVRGLIDTRKPSGSSRAERTKTVNKEESKRSL